MTTLTGKSWHFFGPRRSGRGFCGDIAMVRAMQAVRIGATACSMGRRGRRTKETSTRNSLDRETWEDEEFGTPTSSECRGRRPGHSGPGDDNCRPGSRNGDHCGTFKQTSTSADEDEHLRTLDLPEPFAVWARDTMIRFTHDVGAGLLCDDGSTFQRYSHDDSIIIIFPITKVGQMIK